MEALFRQTCRHRGARNEPHGHSGGHRELSLRDIPFARQLSVPIEYKGLKVDCSFRLDLLVASSVVVEIKAVSSLEPIHTAQLLTYMKLGGWRLGLLINFNVPVLKDGIRRVIL